MSVSNQIWLESTLPNPEIGSWISNIFFDKMGYSALAKDGNGLSGINNILKSDTEYTLNFASLDSGVYVEVGLQTDAGVEYITNNYTGPGVIFSSVTIPKNTLARLSVYPPIGSNLPANQTCADIYGTLIPSLKTSIPSGIIPAISSPLVQNIINNDGSLTINFSNYIPSSTYVMVASYPISNATTYAQTVKTTVTSGLVGVINTTTNVDPPAGNNIYIQFPNVGTPYSGTLIVDIGNKLPIAANLFLTYI